jgi:uncharacterized protein YqjF (DUF2071 family)
LRPLVPAGLTVQEFAGSAWVGVVPFHMEGVMRRPLPDLPGISAFPELNVRTYVERNGKPGVWFLSLDATNRLAVWSARRFFHLPYYRADIHIESQGTDFVYRLRRLDAPPVHFEARYGPNSPPYLAKPGTLEHWLTERYCLYAMSTHGALSRTDVHHHPWPLQDAHATITRDDMLSPLGLSVTGQPLLHYSRRLDVVVWSPGAEVD